MNLFRKTGMQMTKKEKKTGVNFSQSESIVSCGKEGCNGRSFSGVAADKSDDVESRNDRHREIATNSTE